MKSIDGLKENRICRKIIQYKHILITLFVTGGIGICLLGLGVYVYHNSVVPNSFRDIDYSSVRNLIKGMIISMLGFTSVIMVYICLSQNVKKEIVYSVMILFWGIIYGIAIPPVSVPDEPSHFATAYRYSNKILGVEDADEEFVACRNEDGQGHFGIYPSIGIYQYFTEHIFEKTEKVSNDSVYATGPALHGVVLIEYLPQTMGITFARCLKLSDIGLMYLGQLFNLLFYIVVIYFAIKITPFGKNIFGLISIFPMVLQQTMSFSYDMITCGLAFLNLAYLWHLIYEKENINYKDMLLWLFMAMLLAPCKTVFFVISFIGILIPQSKFSSKLQKWEYVGSVFVILLIEVMVLSFASVQNVATGNYVEWAGEEGYTVGYLLTHILRAVEVYIGAIYQYLGYYIETCIGGSLGSLEIPVSSVVIVGFVILLCITIYGKEKMCLPNIHKALYMVIFLGIAAMVLLSMLLAWTPLSRTVIMGVQGRYFLPILPLLVVCFLQKNQNRDPYKLIVSMGCILNYVAILNVLQYVTGR